MDGVHFPQGKRVKIETHSHYTPRVRSATPLVIDGSTNQLKLKTWQLHDKSNEFTVVTVGGHTCELVSTSSTETKCTLPELPMGTYKLRATAWRGDAKFDEPISITVAMKVTTMSPTIAGVNGGARITLRGVGFDENTIVRVRQANGVLLCEFCYKESVTPNQIVFVAPRSQVAGQATVTVTHEFMPPRMAPSARLLGQCDVS